MLLVPVVHAICIQSNWICVLHELVQLPQRLYLASSWMLQARPKPSLHKWTTHDVDLLPVHQLPMQTRFMLSVPANDYGVDMVKIWWWTLLSAYLMPFCCSYCAPLSCYSHLDFETAHSLALLHTNARALACTVALTGSDFNGSFILLTLVTKQTH